MERITYRITLDAHRNGIQRTLQGFDTSDNMARRIAINLASSGTTYEIPLINVVAMMYVTTPSATEPDIHTCTIEDNTIIYDVEKIAEEGVTEMRLKLIEASVDGAEMVIISPRFAIEVINGGVSDGGGMQTKTFTALENALAKAEGLHNSRLLSVGIEEDCTFKVYYADGTVYENNTLNEAILSQRNGLQSLVEEAKSIVENVDGIVDEAIKHTNYTKHEINFETGELLYESQNVIFDINETNGDLEYTTERNPAIKFVEYGTTTWDAIHDLVVSDTYPVVKVNGWFGLALATYQGNHVGNTHTFIAILGGNRITVTCDRDTNEWNTSVEAIT